MGPRVSASLHGLCQQEQESEVGVWNSNAAAHGDTAFDQVTRALAQRGSMLRRETQLTLRFNRCPSLSFFVCRYFAAVSLDCTSIETRSTISMPDSSSARSFPGLLEMTRTLHKPKSKSTSAHCRYSRESTARPKRSLASTVSAPSSCNA